MTEMLEPTDGEKAKVLLTFSEMIERFQGAFKIGRCAVANFDSLDKRADLTGALKIKNLFIGSKRRAAWVEQWLAAKGMEQYPARCANEPHAPHPEVTADANVVFVALW